MLEGRPPACRTRRLARGLGIGCVLVLSGSMLSMSKPSASALAQPHRSSSLAPQALARRLRAGGYVLVMRHAHSPLEPPSAAEPGNSQHERQLDAAGKASARALGAALHALGIPIGPVYSSPTFRARETIKLAGLPSPTLVSQLAEGAHGMGSSAEESHAAWLREAVDRFPPIGSNTLVVTHTPNIVGAFGPRVANIQGNEMLVFVPESGRRARLLGRITVELPAASP